MASLDAKVRENVAGKFYVDSSCIYCELCDEIPPIIFRHCDEHGYAFVHKQPTTPEELKLCMNAVKACPTNSIGTDGW